MVIPQSKHKIDESKEEKKPLQAISKDIFQNVKSEITGFIFSNDSDLPQAIQKSIKRKTSAPPDKKSLAFTVGNGHFLSTARMIPCDAYLHCDIAEDVYVMTHFMRNTLLTCRDEKEFLQKIQTHKLDRFGYDVLFDYEQEKHILKSEHCFATKYSLGQFFPKQHIDDCKKSLEKPFSAVCIDLFNEEQVRKLADEIRQSGYVITFLNLSNLLDWDSELKLIQNLRMLPMIEQPNIVMSTGNPYLRLYLNGIFERGLSSFATDVRLNDLEAILIRARIAVNYAQTDQIARFILFSKEDWAPFIADEKDKERMKSTVEERAYELGYRKKSKCGLC